MKEPSVEDSGYTRGLKTGSFNYLDGGTIGVTEKITYHYGYGNETSNSSSWVNHNLNVKFNGTRGISEFYGKGFFRNNRAVSAWKKIRYEDLSRYENVPLLHIKNGYSTATLGKTRTSNNFSVDASVEMKTGSGSEDYTFKYVANATDAVIETKDALGWSNRTGAERIDFEHDTLMSGEQLNITNTLIHSAPWPVEAGNNDWLSCCIGGTDWPYYPAMDNNDSWPNEGTRKTLSPAKILPNVNRTQYCTVDPWGQLRCTEPTYKEFSCNDKNCTGFGCIYEFGQIESAETEGKSQEYKLSKSIVANQFYPTLTELDGNTTGVNYTIRIKNSGDIKLTNVTLFDILPLNMKYNSSSYEDGGEPRRLNESDIGDETDHLWSVTLSLGDLDTGGRKTVFLKATHEGAKKGDYTTNKVYVTGDAPDKSQVNDTAKAPLPPPALSPEQIAAEAQG